MDAPNAKIFALSAVSFLADNRDVGLLQKFYKYVFIGRSSWILY